MLDPDGTVHRAGYFEIRKPLAQRLRFGRQIEWQLKKSAIWRRLLVFDSRITEDDIRLYFAVVRRSQELLTAQFPGIQFRIILWPGHSGSAAQRSAYEKMRDGFLLMGIPVDLVADILPGYNADPKKFHLSSVGHTRTRWRTACWPSTW